jgi:hypothetical protein
MVRQEHILWFINGQMDYVIGRNILNCYIRYDIRLEEILSSHFQSRDSHFNANTDHSVLLAPLIELLQCRDDFSSLSNNFFSSADITSMIDFLCTC